MLKRLLVAADVDRTLIERVSSDPRFHVRLQPVRTEDELLSVIGDAEVLVTRAYNKVTRRVMERATSLELIAQGTSGTDNIDDVAARERGISIVSLPGENANAVAELVIGSIISLTRTVPFYTREVVNSRWHRDDCATRHEMHHYRLGIIGLGQVGRRVARLAGAFGMPVTAFDPYITNEDFAERGAVRAGTLPSLLHHSDIVTIHVPLSRETRGMLGSSEMASLKRGSMVISMARGEALDQDAALELLASGHLAGLAIDVFDPEPPAGGFPDDPRLILTPHIAGCSHECKAAIGAKLFEKIAEFYSSSRA
ncbi:MAG TPA: NAD(P)-dependent oxidoreductase [Thermoanaerobaculia bacterium]|nr:NAD(P)-dependent oxidoreductase [Thermoanaerobaculia bacterium]